MIRTASTGYNYSSQMSVNLGTVGYIICAYFMRLSNPVLYKQNYTLVKIAFLLNKYIIKFYPLAKHR